MVPDINSLNLRDEVIEVSGDVRSEDFYKQSLPDDGDWVATLALGNDGVTLTRQKGAGGQKDGAPYCQAHVMSKITQTANGTPVTATGVGLVVFDRLTSIIFASKGTSALHAAMDVLGSPIPPRATLGEIEDAVKLAFAQTPQAGITTQWEAQVEDTRQPKGSKDRFKTVLKGQKKFPPVLDKDGQPTGRYETEFTDPASGLQASTQVRITRYFKP